MKVQTTQENIMDKVKWSLATLFLLLPIAGNLYFINQSLLLRSGVSVALLLVAFGIAYTTSTGAKMLTFFSEAKSEVKRVVWPTRQETIQATLLVMAAVVIMSIALWGIDMVLFRLVSYITV